MVRGRFIREGIFVYIWLIHTVVQQKLKQHCKAITLKFKINQDMTVVQSCPNLCNPMDCRTSGFPVLHYLPEFVQIHVY